MEICGKSQVNFYFYLPKELRNELSRPYGILYLNEEKLINDLKKFNRIITVGDVVTKTLLNYNIYPNLAIIDEKTKRFEKLIKIKNLENFNTITIYNEAGVIRFYTICKIRQVMSNLTKNSRILIKVEGEEDLLVIPVLLYSHYKDVVLYGQPNVGIVLMESSEPYIWRVKNIISKMLIKYE